MSLPRDGSLSISQELLDQQAPDLYERFLKLADKYQYRDVSRALADALLAWVETHERSDTGRPPAIIHDAGPDATLQDSRALGSIVTPPPPAPDDGDSSPPTDRGDI